MNSKVQICILCCKYHVLSEGCDSVSKRAHSHLCSVCLIRWLCRDGGCSVSMRDGGVKMCGGCRDEKVSKSARGSGSRRSNVSR